MRPGQNTRRYATTDVSFQQNEDLRIGGSTAKSREDWPKGENRVSLQWEPDPGKNKVGACITRTWL